MNKIEKKIKLLELAIYEEHFFIKEHQSRINFYSGFISSLFAAIIVGFFNATTISQLIILTTSPLITFFISRIAISATRTIYLRFLEAVTVRAKLEQELKLTKLNKNKKMYWENEPLIPIRHIKSRNQEKSSIDFINVSLNGGYRKKTVLLFKFFQFISIIFIIGFLTFIFLI